jgi:hypothetical protein
MRRSKRQAPRTRPPDKLEAALASLARLKIDALRDSWRAWLLDAPPPCQSGRVLRLLLAWRLQEKRFGGLSAAARRQLRQLAGQPGKTMVAAAPALKRGMVLARAWKGVMHRVHVLEQGFAHEGKVYATLSEAARAITGTRWSGPRFFGVRSGEALEP